MNLSGQVLQPDSLEFAGNMIDNHEMYDSRTPSLLEVTGIAQHGMATVSGLNDYDYQNLSSLSMGQKQLNQLATINKVPIPPEVMEHFKHIKCHCMMGLFPEIGRAWLTIDSDIYIWTYENSRDVAYFDGLNHLIVSVGLVTPKPGVFIPDIKYLLIITTPIEIVILGVTFGNDSTKTMSSPSRSMLNNLNIDEMQLINKPIFIINTDNIAITTVEGTTDGRIFLGGRDGCLYEICYQAESNWFGKRCKKVNHSQSLMSYMVPGFLKVFSDTDSIIKLTIDNTRQLLYVLTEKGTIEAWNYGGSDGGNLMQRIARLTQNDIAYHAGNILKTLDTSVFKPVTAICPLTLNDSKNLHLLAITQSGVRFYFATTPLIFVNQQVSQAVIEQQQQQNKPQGLYLLHVRLPPGYTPNATVGKPKRVHCAYYNEGTILMVSNSQQENDLLWSLSSEPFPYRQYLAESSTVLPLDGQVWAMAELKQRINPKLTTLKNRQTSKKVVLLTNQGAHIFSLYKPVDLLQQLLISCHGPHHDAVKAYFKAQSEPQACATSVMLACMESVRGTEMVLWATQAFLLYGGEPTSTTNQLNLDHHHQQQQQQNSPRMFNSTPYTSRAASSIQQSLMQQTQYPVSPINNYSFNSNNSNMQTGGDVTIIYSAKHAGLYLHLSRLLRSIWKKRCIDINLNSTITQNDCSNILDDLYALKGFLEINPISNIAGLVQNYGTNNTILRNTGGQQPPYNNYYQNNNNMLGGGRIEDTYTEEKKSLEALNRFIKHTCEVMALWKILCEHQFNLLALALPKEHQNILQASIFRDLILFRADTCAYFIVTLINSYLNDNASLSSISTKLRTVCPTLYRHEDAISHKATEILLLSKTCTDTEEKDEKLRTALQLCKDAAPNLPLSSICQQFTVAGFYVGVIELCATCAIKLDPNDAALHFYNNNEPIEDQDGFMAFTSRMNCYKEIKIMLEQVYQNLCNTILNPQNKTDYQINNNNNNNDDKETTSLDIQILKIISIGLQTSDYLLHNSVYEWLLSHQLLEKLLGSSEPSLGNFLSRALIKNENNLMIADLLWKYHERNKQHAEAARILDNLASMQSETITLNQRIEYLARAVMCMRSDTIGSSAHNGVLLRDLEDKLEISRIQKDVLEAIECLKNTNNNVTIQDAIKSLNYMLYNMTQLYTDFAEQFNLWDCKLNILNCSHHNDPLLIESVWTHILDKELQTSGSPFEKSSRLITKVQSLAREHGNSGHCFPLSFLVRELEIRCCRLKLENSPVPSAFIDMNLDIGLLLDIYSRLVSLNERIWAIEGSEWHLIKAVQQFGIILAGQPNLINIKNRRKIAAKVQDLISACLNFLYTKPDTKGLVDSLREIQAKIQRNLN